MRTHPTFAYQLPTSQELHELRRRAETERAQAIRELFARLRPRGRKTDEEHQPQTAIATGACV